MLFVVVSSVMAGVAISFLSRKVGVCSVQVRQARSGLFVEMSSVTAGKSRILNHVEVSPVKAGKVGMLRIMS